jgi:TolB-like protein
MASLIPDFENDVFISYRQKDNRGEQWVSDFVEDLRFELDKTFKEEISVYFDINPRDGLLDTHDVDASLREKLKCLVFMPVVSRTYCDPSSYAWENEFRAFIEQASRDQFGLKVKLSDGKLGNRVIPVQIYDLDIKDTRLFESTLGTALRGIEFIYREPGVNRPLTRLDTDEKNLSGTKYRNQVNRVANSIKEIIYGLRAERIEYGSMEAQAFPGAEKLLKQEKSIIVLPFQNISPDSGQEYFSDGLTEEVISDLSLVPDLLVISRRSAMTFRGSKNTIKEIADKVNVRYVLEGSVRKESNNLRITAQLIDSVNDSHIWGEKYSGTLEDVFDIQEKVSQSIVGALKIKLSSREKKKIHERPIDNVFAYDCYRKAYHEITSYNKERIEHGLYLLQKGIDTAGENAVMYAGMAYAYFQCFNAGVDQGKNLRNAAEYVQKSFALNPDLAEAHFVMACIDTINGKPEDGMEHILRAHAAKPEDPEILIWLAEAYTLIGRPEAGKAVISKCIKIDPVYPMMDSVIGWNHFYDGKFDLAMHHLVTAYNLTPESRMNQFWKSLILLYNNRPEGSYEFISQYVQEPARDSWTQLAIFLKYILKGEKDKLEVLLSPDFIKAHWLDPQNSYLIAALYSYLGEKEQSLKWLEHAVEGGFMNFPFLNEYDPLLKNIRGENRFIILLEKVRQQWERFAAYCDIKS